MAENKEHDDQIPEPDARHKVETRIQEKIDSGYTAPCGWLFRGFVFFFSQQDQPKDEGWDTEDSQHPKTADNIRLSLARNTARFAGATNASSLESTGITHVIIDPATFSSEEIASLRKSLASKWGGKIAHLVTLDWVEECWKNGTLLDEESKSYHFNTKHYPFNPWCTRVCC